MSEKKITYCVTLNEANEKYTEYLENHIKGVKEAYNMAYDAFKDVFPDVYIDNYQVRKLIVNLNKHDETKFDFNEFISYRNKFFPFSKNSERDESEFQIAWLHHVNNNAHHPAHWALVEDNEIKIFDMPDIYIIEMLCDWMAMSKYYNSTTLEYWKSESAKKLPMSIYTISKVDEFMKWMQDHNVHTLW